MVCNRHCQYEPDVRAFELFDKCGNQRAMGWQTVDVVTNIHA